MSLNPERLLERLAELSQVGGTPRRYVVAFSGGLDSTVLAHALIQGRDAHGASICLAHVDHGLQPDSSAWADHCRAFATAHEVDFIERRAAVDPKSGYGIEAAARDARYATLRELLEPGDWLFSAHHQDDQAETLLLNLMRSSGPAGLAGISAIRQFAAGWLVRPLLDVPRSDLQAYAETQSLQWIADPSNLDQQFDRNYLRHEIVPRLDARWTDAAKRIRRSAALAGEAASLLSELAAEDALRLGDRADRLSITGLRLLSPSRQRNLLRHLVSRLGLPMPGAVHVEKIVSELIPARDDAQPLVTWAGAMVRRYRDQLYVLPADDIDGPGYTAERIDGDNIPLRGGLGTLVLCRDAASGLSDAVLACALELRYRTGGEEIKTDNQSPTKKLKKLLQQEGVVPWMRDRIPLLYAGGELVAVGDLWLAAGAVSEPGTAIVWRNRPAIH